MQHCRMMQDFLRKSCKCMGAMRPVMPDVVGTTLDADDLRRIRHPLTGGVILFARNYTDRAPSVSPGACRQAFAREYNEMHALGAGRGSRPGGRLESVQDSF